VRRGYSWSTFVRVVHAAAAARTICARPARPPAMLRCAAFSIFIVALSLAAANARPTQLLLLLLL